MILHGLPVLLKQLLLFSWFMLSAVLPGLWMPAGWPSRFGVSTVTIVAEGGLTKKSGASDYLSGAPWI